MDPDDFNPNVVDPDRDDSPRYGRHNAMKIWGQYCAVDVETIVAWDNTAKEFFRYNYFGTRRPIR